MTKRTAIDFKEVRYLEVECANCHARLTLDLDNDQSRVPSHCAACNTPFDPQATKPTLQNFMDARRVAMHQEQRLTFRIVVEKKEDNDG